jgi:hypothetical protein
VVASAPVLTSPVVAGPVGGGTLGAAVAVGRPDTPAAAGSGTVISAHTAAQAATRWNTRAGTP